MQNLTTMASNHNVANAEQPHPQVAAATSQHNASSNTSPVPEAALPLAQPHTELTESDTELLAASELHNEFEYNTTMPNERPNHGELLLNELSSNDYLPTPTQQEYNDANMLSLEQWLLNTIPQYHTQYPAAPPLNTTHEISLITQYLKDIATFSTLTINVPLNMWPFFATEYISEAFLLNVIRSRAEDYQPYVWNKKYRAHIARKEAEAMDNYINRYDRQAFLMKHYENTTAHQNQ